MHGFAVGGTGSVSGRTKQVADVERDLKNAITCVFLNRTGPALCPPGMVVSGYVVWRHSSVWIRYSNISGCVGIRVYGMMVHFCTDSVQQYQRGCEGIGAAAHIGSCTNTTPSPHELPGEENGS